MWRRIMVPLDGSELAERALPCAEQVAAALGGVLHLVHIVPPPVREAFAPPHLFDELLTGERAAAGAYLDAIRARLTRIGDARVQAEWLLGDVSAELLDYERDAGMDLVVMCSHGRGGLARFALGSVADRLLRHGTAPVLLVRAFGAEPTLQRAVVPLDGSPLSETALLAVDQLADYILHEVTLLRVVHAPEQIAEAEGYLEETSRSLQRPGLRCLRRVKVGDPASLIIELAGAEQLVVMATHGRSGLARWALGSVADRVARHGAAATLLVRAGTVKDDRIV